MNTRRSWREKLNNSNLPKVVPVPPAMERRLGAGTLLIPNGPDVEAVIRDVRKGRLITMSGIRCLLAGKFQTDTACPLVTGIFVRLCAEAAEEDSRAGKKRIMPYWRVVRDDGSLNPKYPGGAERQAARLREEGHEILAATGSRPPRVAGLAKTIDSPVAKRSKEKP